MKNREKKKNSEQEKKITRMNKYDEKMKIYVKKKQRERQLGTRMKNKQDE